MKMKVCLGLCLLLLALLLAFTGFEHGMTDKARENAGQESEAKGERPAPETVIERFKIAKGGRCCSSPSS
jgi:hypothetical protein